MAWRTRAARGFGRANAEPLPLPARVHKARSCVGMLVLDRVASVVCEEHEDFVVIYADGAVELVSVKHRENSKGPWTFATLCSEGGVRHLYGRWLATGRSARCRVMTNAGVKPGKLEASEFIAACQSRQAAQVEPYLEKLQTALGSQDRNRVREFALVLSVESALPGRPHIAAVNLREFYWPALEELGLVYDFVEPYYDRVLDLIARANRDQVGERLDLRDALLDPGRFDEAATTDRRIKAPRSPAVTCSTRCSRSRSRRGTLGRRTWGATPAATQSHAA